MVLIGDIKDRLIELIYQKAQELELEVAQANLQPDPVHLFALSKPIHAL